MSFTISGLITYLIQESLSIMSSFGPAGVFLLMVFEGIGLPFPSEVIMVFAGFLSSGSIISFVIYALAGSIGGYVGNLLLYYISAFGGRPLILFIGKYAGLKEEHLARTERWFDERGEWTVFFGRFVPGFRSYMSIPAGVSKMKVGKFSVFTLSGSLIWSTALAAGGYAVGKSWNTLVPIIERIGIVLLVIFILGFVIYILYRLYLKRKVKENPGPS